MRKLRGRNLPIAFLAGTPPQAPGSVDFDLWNRRSRNCQVASVIDIVKFPASTEETIRHERPRQNSPSQEVHASCVMSILDARRNGSRDTEPYATYIRTGSTGQLVYSSSFRLDMNTTSCNQRCLSNAGRATTEQRCYALIEVPSSLVGSCQEARSLG